LDTTSGGTLTNSGSLLADGPGSFLAISGNGISNSGRGTIQATNGGTVELQYGGFINNGFVTAGPGSTFSIGILATFDNTGVTPGSSSTLQSPAGGTLQLNGGMISGGTVSGAGGTFLNATPPGGYGSTLDGTPTGGITLIGTLMHNNGASTFLQGLINDPDGFMFDSAPAAGAGAYYNLLLASDTELSGAGTTTTLANSNGGTINFGGPTANNGSMITCSQLTIDDGHRLLVQADVPNSNLGVVVTLTNNGTVQADGPNNQFYLALANASSNAGTIAATNGALVTLDNSAGGTFDNSGTLEATNGGIITLVSAGLTNTGLIVLHDGTINTDIPLAIGDGTLCGSGTINGDVMLDSDPSTLAFEIRSGMDFDSLTINGNIYLAGDLEITLAPGAIVIENDSFDILTADSLSGSFLDVADGQRLQTTDGGGSFLVNYGTGADADEIVLSDFQSIPEPASASLLLMGAGGLLVRRRLFSKG
jgi:hypothetical protein